MKKKINDAYVPVKFTQETKAEIKKRAEKMGLTSSGLIRWVMINFLRGKR